MLLPIGRFGQIVSCGHTIMRAIDESEGRALGRRLLIPARDVAARRPPDSPAIARSIEISGVAINVIAVDPALPDTTGRRAVDVGNDPHPDARRHVLINMRLIEKSIRQMIE